MKLQHLRANVYYIAGFVNIGVLTNGKKEAIIVDAGLDEGVARRISAVLDENGLSIKGIIVTHAHADHYGGASHLTKHAGARIYASSPEKAVMENPLLEAVCLFGGAYPPAELRRKYFYAPRTTVHQTVSPGETIVEGLPVEIVDLSGHTTGQIGVAAEGVMFCADAVATPAQIPKQGILKNAGIEQCLQTFERLTARRDALFVPSHGDVQDTIKPLTDQNKASVNETLDLVLSLTEEPVSVEDLLARLCEEKAMTINSLSHYGVLHLSILAYLGCLLDRQQLRVLFHNSKQLFQRSR